MKQVLGLIKMSFKESENIIKFNCILILWCKNMSANVKCLIYSNKNFNLQSI